MGMVHPNINKLLTAQAFTSVYLNKGNTAFFNYTPPVFLHDPAP